MCIQVVMMYGIVCHLLCVVKKQRTQMNSEAKNDNTSMRYMQQKNSFTRKKETGKCADSTKIPSENALAEAYQVSRDAKRQP